MVCATSPSSGAAAWCRLFAELTPKELGQHVEVLFEGGGGGNTAAEYVIARPIKLTIIVIAVTIILFSFYRSRTS